MKGKQTLEVDGVVKECLPNEQFLVEFEVNGNKHEIFGYRSGKMRMHYITIMEGDKVKIELTPYDKTKGRIIYRYK